MKTASGDFLLAMLGNGTQSFNSTPIPPQQHCKGLGAEQGDSRTSACPGGGCPWSYDTSLLFSRSVLGPWTPLPRRLLEAGPFGAWNAWMTAAITNHLIPCRSCRMVLLSRQA